MPRWKDEPKTLGELGVLGANLFRFGEQTRAKDAKDAKVKGKAVKEPVPNGTKLMRSRTCPFVLFMSLCAFHGVAL
jgi:hypothetical protein